jgi:hypothetical protein
MAPSVDAISKAIRVLKSTFTFSNSEPKQISSEGPRETATSSKYQFKSKKPRANSDFFRFPTTEQYFFSSIPTSSLPNLSAERRN